MRYSRIFCLHNGDEKESQYDLDLNSQQMHRRGSCGSIRCTNTQTNRGMEAPYLLL